MGARWGRRRRCPRAAEQSGRGPNPPPSWPWLAWENVRNSLPSAGAELAARALGPRGPHLESVILDAGQRFLAHANKLPFKTCGFHRDCRGAICRLCWDQEKASPLGRPIRKRPPSGSSRGPRLCFLPATEGSWHKPQLVDVELNFGCISALIAPHQLGAPGQGTT